MSPVLLHIGPQKTGSTAIQRSMDASREALAEHGVYYPGPWYRMRTQASWAVMGTGSAVGRPAPDIAAWHELLDDIGSHTLRLTCLSSEALAMSDEAAVERIVAGLGGGENVRLVYVARRLDRLLPSHWQERVKSRLLWSYPQFLDLMLGEPDRADFEWRMMWRPQLVGEVVERWSAQIPVEQITVVVADEDDPGLLPRSFEELLGVPAGVLAAPTSGQNRSLTYAEAEAIRRVNHVFAEQGWSPEQYWRLVQAGVAESLKNAPLPPDAARMVGYTADQAARVDALADEQVAALTGSGAHLVGDPERLRTRGLLEPVSSQPPIAEVSLELLGSVVEGLVVGGQGLTKRKIRERRRAARAADPLATASAGSLARELARRARRRLPL
ncbi:hypothetical protein D9V37_00180 [Nocardioides mangrovicus]|uniref:Sulfotransferase family protein n=1 Tax=Nocardioides mangrovicus TaxID=2478913 RepID=A0A3L8P650_9ACTN|nr:hypothetical protein [Nocardioides mangrovicus]RLV50452.1 hypothetical protein D9V37_00180 [Nocardioides mangrovicus]